jgi:hypothetical protein
MSTATTPKQPSTTPFQLDSIVLPIMDVKGLMTTTVSPLFGLEHNPPIDPKDPSKGGVDPAKPVIIVSAVTLYIMLAALQIAKLQNLDMSDKEKMIELFNTIGPTSPIVITSMNLVTTLISTCDLMTGALPGLATPITAVGAIMTLFSGIVTLINTLSMMGMFNIPDPNPLKVGVLTAIAAIFAPIVALQELVQSIKDTVGQVPIAGTLLVNILVPVALSTLLEKIPAIGAITALMNV